MKIMDGKGNKIKRPLTKFAVKNNGRVLNIGIVPHDGRLLRKLKNKRRVEEMKNTICCDNYMPDFIEGVDIDDGISLLESFKSMRKGFLRARIGKGEISEDDPIVKKFLEE